jgi:hypothetical protein
MRLKAFSQQKPVMGVSHLQRMNSLLLNGGHELGNERMILNNLRETQNSQSPELLFANGHSRLENQKQIYKHMYQQSISNQPGTNPSVLIVN